MELSIHTIFDLIMKSMKNAFLIDNLTIESIEELNNKIQVIFIDEDDERLKYQITLAIETKNYNNSVKSEIKYTDIRLLTNVDRRISLTIYDCKSVVKVNTTLDTLLEEVVFDRRELEAIEL